MSEERPKYSEIELSALLSEPLANGRSVPDGSRFPVLRLTALRNGQLDFSEYKHGNWSEEAASPFKVKRGDLLVARGNGSLHLVGRAALVIGEPPPVAFPDTMIRVRVASSRVDPRFLAIQWEASRTRAQIERAARTTAGIFKISQGDLLSLRFAIPPLPQQREIVPVLDNHFSRLDAAVASLTRAKANVKRARASVLKAAVEGRLVPTEAALARAEGRDYEPASVLLSRILTERRARWAESGGKGKYKEPVAPDSEMILPEGWICASCDQVGDIMLGRQKAPQYLTGKYSTPYLRVANIKDDRIDFSDIDQMDFDAAHLEKYQLRAGDILVSEGQSPELVGQSAIYRGGWEKLCFQKALHRFRPLEFGPPPAFAQIVFRAWVSGRVFMRRASITTNIAHLTLEKFKASPFPLPPFSEQHRIVAEVDRQLSVLNALDATIDANLARCAKLRQSILKRAFEGKLVRPETPAKAKKPQLHLFTEEAPA